MNKQRCQKKGHDNFDTDFVCLGNCLKESKLACSQCKTFQHSQCGLKCVPQNDFRIFLSQQVEQLTNFQINTFDNNIGTLKHFVDAIFNDMSQQNQKNKKSNYSEMQELINNCKIFKDQYPYDRKDCDNIYSYFHNKINVEFKNNQTQFSFNLRNQEIEKQINTLTQDTIEIIKSVLDNFKNQYNKISSQSIFFENTPMNPVEIVQQIQNTQINNFQLPKSIKEFKIMDRQNQKFTLNNDIIINNDVDNQLIIFEPKINTSEQNFSWGFKIVEHGLMPLVWDNPVNGYDLGIGIIGANYLNDKTYKKSENQQYIVFSTKSTNFKSISGFYFTQQTAIRLSYDVKNKTLTIKGQNRGSVIFNIDNNDYYPCLVMSKQDKVQIIQPKDIVTQS